MCIIPMGKNGQGIVLYVPGCTGPEQQDIYCHLLWYILVHYIPRPSIPTRDNTLKFTKEPLEPVTNLKVL